VNGLERGYLRRLVGRVLALPEHGCHPPTRLKIIQLVVDHTDPRRVSVHGIRLDNGNREFEGRTVILTPTDIGGYLEPPPAAPSVSGGPAPRPRPRVQDTSNAAAYSRPRGS